MRAQCLSSDRPDIQIECRDLARKMQQLSNLDEIGLKRLSRLLGVRPRLVWLFKCQKLGCALMLGKRWSPKARSHSARSLPQRCLQTFSRNTSMLQRCKVAWLDWNEIPVRREQANPESMNTFSRQRRLLRRDVETGYRWSRKANSGGGYSCGTGGLRCDDPMKSSPPSSRKRAPSCRN